MSTTQWPVTAGKLARQLHATDRGELEIEITAGAQFDPSTTPGASVHGGKLRFARLEDRNSAAAADVLAELGGPPFDEQAVWAAAHDLLGCEIGNTDMASGRLLAAVHPSVSVLRLATARITCQADVFDALHLVEAALPYLETIELSDVVALCDAEQPHTMNDFAGGVFYHALSRWFGRKPAAARDMVEMLLTQPCKVRGALLGAAWMAWFASDQQQTSVSRLLEADSCSDLAEFHEVTCWIVGRMLAEPSLPAELAPALEAPVLLRIIHEDVVQRRAGLRAASAVLHLRRTFDVALRARIAEGDQDAVGFVAQALSRNDEDLQRVGIFFEWLPLCVGLGEGFERALDGLDFSLSRLLSPKSTHVGPVLEFLEAWVRAHPDATSGKREFADRFDACTRALLSQPPLLSRVFTRWMLADGQATATAAASMISAARTDHVTIEFDGAVLDTATDADLWYLAKRTLGFLLDPKQMLSLALSLLALRDAKVRVFPLLRWMLYEQLGYDHPGTTSDALQKQAGQETDADIKELLGSIAARLDADMAELQALPRLRELEVPMALRRDFAKARDKVMQRSMRDAQKQSVFAQLLKRVHIKAGETSFQHQGESWTEPMHFASHSVSFEMPRREVLDPVGNAYRRLQLRTTKRDLP